MLKITTRQRQYRPVKRLAWLNFLLFSNRKDSTNNQIAGYTLQEQLKILFWRRDKHTWITVLSIAFHATDRKIYFKMKWKTFIFTVAKLFMRLSNFKNHQLIEFQEGLNPKNWKQALSWVAAVSTLSLTYTCLWSPAKTIFVFSSAITRGVNHSGSRALAAWSSSICVKRNLPSW